MASGSDNKVCLESWWLIKAEKDFNGRSLAIGGLTMGEQQELRSLPIIKRHDFFTLETVDGITITINGLINMSRTKENGFSHEVCDLFEIGFPFDWETYGGTWPLLNPSKRNSSAEDHTDPTGFDAEVVVHPAMIDKSVHMENSSSSNVKLSKGFKDSKADDDVLKSEITNFCPSVSQDYDATNMVLARSDVIDATPLNMVVPPSSTDGTDKNDSTRDVKMTDGTDKNDSTRDVKMTASVDISSDNLTRISKTQENVEEETSGSSTRKRTYSRFSESFSESLAANEASAKGAKLAFSKEKEKNRP